MTAYDLLTTIYHKHSTTREAHLLEGRPGRLLVGHPLVDLVVVASISPHPVVTQQATPWHGVWISTCKGRHRHGCKATAAQLTPAGGKLFQILISLSVRKFNHFKVSFV